MIIKIQYTPIAYQRNLLGLFLCQHADSYIVAACCPLIEMNHPEHTCLCRGFPQFVCPNPSCEGEP